MEGGSALQQEVVDVTCICFHTYWNPTAEIPPPFSERLFLHTLILWLRDQRALSSWWGTAATDSLRVLWYRGHCGALLISSNPGLRLSLPTLAGAPAQLSLPDLAILVPFSS